MSITPLVLRPEPTPYTTILILTSRFQEIMQAIAAADFYISESETYLKDSGDDLDDTEEAAIYLSIAEMKETRWSLLAMIPALFKDIYPADIKEIVSGEAA